VEIASPPIAEKNPPKRRWCQYSLRTLMVLVTLCAFACSWLAVKMQQARKQREAVETIQKLGGVVQYLHETGTTTTRGRPPGPAWLRKILGDDFFAYVVQVYLADTQITDDCLEHLRGMSQLTVLFLDNTNITDAGLKHLDHLTQLRYMSLKNTHVTDNGLKRLAQELPNCHLVH
jgi:hypothetical protein